MVPDFKVALAASKEDPPRNASGACILIKNTYLVSDAYSKISFQDGASYSVAASVASGILLVSAYFSPTAKIDKVVQELSNCLAYFAGSSVGLFIVAGGFDINLGSGDGQVLQAILATKGLVPIFPPSFSTTTSQTSIDHVVTNIKPHVAGRYISITSYHDALYITYDTSLPLQPMPVTL